MAYFKCDDCGKEHHIFGEPQGAEVAERYNIPAYTTLPIDPKFARLCDEARSKTTTWKASWTSSSTRSSRPARSRMGKQPNNGNSPTSL